ncbi:MAG: ATP-binding protein [Pseudomonadota bacterium]
MTRQATLHLLCGKVASGKSTFAHELAAASGTILLQEDVLLASLYGDELSTLADYVRCSRRLRQAMTPHITALLKEGLSVVLDFPANTIENRQWMMGLIKTADCQHQLHFFDVPNEICKTRLNVRNASGKHEFSVSEEEFDRISSHFQPPTVDEGFNVLIHTAE